MMSVHVINAKFLLLEVCTTTLSPNIWHMKSVHITDAKFLLRKIYYYIESQYLTHKVSTHPWRQVSTAKGQYNFIVSNIWHMKSVHVTETKILLLVVSTTTLSPSIWHQVVSIYDWGKVSFAGGSSGRGHYYYIESQFLTPWCQYT